MRGRVHKRCWATRWPDRAVCLGCGWLLATVALGPNASTLSEMTAFPFSSLLSSTRVRGMVRRVSSISVPRRRWL